MARFKTLSIRLKLFLVYSLLFFLLVFPSYTVLTAVIHSRLQETVQRELENSIDSIIEMLRINAQLSIRNHLESLVDSRLSVIEALYYQYREGLFTEAEARKRAEASLLAVSIGDEGYFYVIDHNGQVLIHPFKDLIGVNFREFDFVRQQTVIRTGYLEYEWKNPGEEESRRKALSMGYFEPWDWIITASAYRDELASLIQLNDLKQAIASMPSGKNGYPFVVSLTGDIVIHPEFEGKNIYFSEDLDEEVVNLLMKIIADKSGQVLYDWQDPGEVIRPKKAYYRYIPEYDWIIGSTVYLDDYEDAPRKMLYSILVLLIASILIFLVINSKIVRMVTTPLLSLVDFIEQSRERGTDLSMRFEYSGSDEISRLAEQFNSFLEDLENERVQRQNTEEKNSILAQFPEGNPSPVIRMDGEGRILYANPAARNQMYLWGHPDQEFIPEDLKSRISDMQERMEVFEYQPEGLHYEVQITYYPSQKAYYLFFSDIRERREAQAQLLLSESVFSNSLDGILITDPDAVIQRVNAAYIDISGYSEDELIGRTPGVMRSDRQDRRFYNSMWESLKRNGYWSGEIWDRRKNGDEIPLLLTINSISSEEGRLAYYVGVFKDISDLKKSEEKLRHQAYYDGLTGLPNRSLFLDRLTQAIAFADRTGTQIAVMFLDLDNFKNINDSMGHNVGDLYLKKISERLRQGCRDEDTVARLGGDEFLVMMPGIDSRKSTEYVVRRFQKALHKPISIEGLEVHTTASMGIACYPSDGTDPLQLMQNADMAMYQSKKRGKDCYTNFEEEMNRNVLLKVELDGRMRKALVLDEFEVFYQPKVEVSDGTVKGAEALIRWNSADGRVISPADFIPLAEENGFILKLGDWILERVLLDLRDMKEVAAGDFQVAVNLSGRQFRDRDLLKRISRIIDSSDQPYESINFEITESVAMEDSQATLEILESLHKLNVGISIDDFGTGYSSLSYLKRFKTHILKIDKSFVDELPEDRKGSALVQDIIHMAHNLDMKIVAEGVEEKKQLDFLKDAGCDTIQGYYFSRPLGKKDFLNYLENHSGGILKHSGS